MLLGLLKNKNINKGILEYEGTNNAVLLDVRSKGEYQEGHIGGSKNIEIEKIDAVSLLIKDKTAPLFVYCYSGSRSNIAVNILRNMGYTNVKNIAVESVPILELSKVRYRNENNHYRRCCRRCKCGHSPT